MIIDEIFYEDEISKRLILGVTSDSTIDKIEIDDQEYKFAKQKTLTGKSTIVAENAIDEPIIDLSIEGNTFQQQYEGYQQIELKDGSKGSKTDSDGNVLSWEIKDGIVTINGMSNAFTVISVDARHFNPIIYKAGTYTYTPFYYRELGDIGMTGCDWKFRDVYSNTDITGYTANTKGVAIKTFDTDFKLVHVQLYIKSNVQYDNYQYTPAIIKGEYATLADLPPYEPYVGGIPSPNPGQKIIFPASPEIDVVSDVYYDGYTATEGDTIYVLASNYKIYSVEEGKTYRVFVDEEKFKERFSAVGDTIMIGNSIEGLLGTNRTEDFWFYHLGLVDFSDSTDPTSPGRYVFETAEISENFYIAVGNTWGGFSIDDEESFWSALSEIGVYIQTTPYAETVQTIPAFPQPIENANDSKLPSGYQQVEYIESTGTQYIDTGVLGKNTLSFYTKATYASETLFGTQDNSNANKCIAVAATYVRYLTSNGVQVVAGLNSVDNYELEISNTKATVYYNGTSKSANLSPTNTTVDYPIYLFARNIYGNASGFSSVKIYSFKIWDNGTLIRDFIPCYRIADNVIGMYDLVNAVFYTNQGTGEFSKGENVGMKLVNKGYNLLNKNEFIREALKNETVFTAYGGRCISDEDLHKILKPNTSYTFSYEVEGVGERPENSTIANGAGFMLWGSGDHPNIYFRISEFASTGEIKKYSSIFTTSTDISVYRLEAYRYQVKLEDGTYTGVDCIIRNVQIVENEIIFNKEQLISKDFTQEEYEGTDCIKIVPTAVNHYFDVDIPVGRFSLYFECAHPDTASDFYIIAYYEDGTTISLTNGVASEASTTFRTREAKQTITKRIVKIDIRFYSVASYRPYYFRNFIISIDKAKPYQPYFKNEIIIPKSVTLRSFVELPNEYQSVVYIESTGTQYIDTGVIPTINTTVEAKVVTKSYDKFIYGSRTSTTSTDKHCVLLNSNTDLVYGQIGNSSTTGTSLVTNNTNIYTVKNGKDGFYINGALIRNYGSVAFAASNLPMYLFALNTPVEAPSKRGFVGRIYSCKIYEGATLIRDFIPCYRKSDNVIGMYDLVNNQFYINDGAGTFTKADGTVVELPMRRVAKMYDESSATEGIDYLKVDRVANKVEYVRGTSALTFDDTYGFISRGNHVFMIQATFDNTARIGTSVYCNKYKSYYSIGKLTNVDYGVTFDGLYYGAPRAVITVKDIRFDNATDFNNSLKDLPIEVVFCLAEPVTTDITNTDLGQALLNLSTYPHTNFFYVYSDPEVNSLQLSFWRQITPADATDEVI